MKNLYQKIKSAIYFAKHGPSTIVTRKGIKKNTVINRIRFLNERSI